MGATRLPRPRCAATEGDLEAQIAALLEERPAADAQEDELNQVRQQMMTAGREARARAARSRTGREQRALAVEVHPECCARQRRLQHENERLQAEPAASLASSKRRKTTLEASQRLPRAPWRLPSRLRPSVGAVKWHVEAARRGQGTATGFSRKLPTSVKRKPIRRHGVPRRTCQRRMAAVALKRNCRKRRAGSGRHGVQMDMLRTDLAKAKSDLAESQADNRSLIADLEEQDVGLDLAQTALTLAVEQRDGIRAEATLLLQASSTRQR